MENPKENYKKYKWFYTGSGKLVIGGKSAAQNDGLLKRIKFLRKDFIVMHTASPGSPFSIILEDIEKVTKKDKEECAVFTACFSKAWKEKSKEISVDVFKFSELYKSKEMNMGTWGVKTKVERIKVIPELVLTRQNGILRAVPKNSAKKKEILAYVYPGNIDKKDAAAKLQFETDEHFSQEELIAALPAGGIKITREKK